MGQRRIRLRELAYAWGITFAATEGFYGSIDSLPRIAQGKEAGLAGLVSSSNVAAEDVSARDDVRDARAQGSDVYPARAPAGFREVFSAAVLRVEMPARGSFECADYAPVAPLFVPGAGLNVYDEIARLNPLPPPQKDVPVIQRARPDVGVYGPMKGLRSVGRTPAR